MVERRGVMFMSWLLQCGQCYQTHDLDEVTEHRAEQAAAATLWANTDERGWLCPDCKPPDPEGDAAKLAAIEARHIANRRRIEAQSREYGLPSPWGEFLPEEDGGEATP